MLRIVRITEKDFDLVKGIDLRQADKNELTTSLGTSNVSEALRMCIRYSSEWTEAAFIDGVCVALYGLGRLNDTTGIPWCVGSPEMVRNKRLFFGFSKKIISRMLDQFPTIANYVDPRNKAHVLWLYRMGFILPEFEGCMVGGQWFRYFYKERE